MSAGAPVRIIDLPPCFNYNCLPIFTTSAYTGALLQSDKYLFVEPDALLIEGSTVQIDEFFQYDYVGSPWPPNAHWISGPGLPQVGNGGCGFGTSSVYVANLLNIGNLSVAEFERVNLDVHLSVRSPNRPMPDVAVRFAAEVGRLPPLVYAPT